MKKFFGKIKEFVKKHKVAVIISCVVIALLLICVIRTSVGLNKAMDMLSSAYGTGEVSVQNLVKSVGATGKISAVESREITTTLTGMKASKVLVSVGDAVKVGDKLVEFDTTDIQSSLEDVKKQYSVQSANEALQASDRNRSYTDTERNQNTSVILAAEKFDKAQETYESRKSDWEYADKEYAAAQEALKADPTNAALIADKHTKDMVEEAARAAYKAAETALDDAERDYYNALAAKDSALALQNSQIQQSNNSQSVSGITYKNQIKKYEQQLSEGTLTSPLAGVVTAVNIKEGDTYAGGVVVTVQDVSKYIVEAEIGEYDISDIEVGKKVIIKTDATRDEELSGTVVFVSPTATSGAAGSSATYKVKISIDTPNDRLRLGMTATMSIIVESHESVMTVPYNAVQKDADGRTYVERAVDSANSGAANIPGINLENRVYVDVIMESNYYTEIKSDELKVGDKVLVVSNSSTNDLFQLMMNGEGF